MFARLNSFLRKTGFRNTAGFALNKLRDQLVGLPVLPDGGTWSLSQGHSKWEGLAIELTAPLAGEALAHLVHVLASWLPIEMTFITHIKPVPRREEDGPYGVSQFLTPLGEVNELRTYLFVRRPAGAGSTRVDDLLRDACAYVGGSYRYLSGDETLTLVQPWSVENTRTSDCPDSPGEALDRNIPSYAAFIAAPEGAHAVHPLQLAAFDRRDLSIETWEVTTVTTPTWDAVHAERNKAKPVVDVSLNKGAPFLVHHRSAVLLAGEEHAVAVAQRERRERFHRAGFSTRVIPAGGAYAAVVAPWLTALTDRPMTLFRDDSPGVAARKLCVPRGLSPDSASSAAHPGGDAQGDATPMNVAALDLRGGLLPLGPRHQCEPSNTLIAGNAGSGLTYTANAMLAAHLAAGGMAWALREAASPVFDDVHSAEELVLSPQSPVSLNPLAGFKTRDDLSQQMSVLRHWVYAMSGMEGAVREEMDELRGMAIENAIDCAWRRAGAELGLEQVIEALELTPTYLNEFWGTKAREIAAALRQRVSSMAREWFNGPGVTDTLTPYLSFTLSGFPAASEESKMIAWSVLALHSQLAERGWGRQRRMMLVDSADLLGDFGARGLLQDVLLRSRKWNVRHVLTTRPFDAPPDAFVTARQALFWELCPLKALMSLDGAHCESWLKTLGRDFAPEEFSAFNNRRLRAFAWSSSGRHRLLPAALQLPAEATVLLAPTPRMAEQYLAARATGAPPRDAIQHATVATSEAVRTRRNERLA